MLLKVLHRLRTRASLSKLIAAGTLTPPGRAHVGHGGTNPGDGRNRDVICVNGLTPNWWVRDYSRRYRSSPQCHQTSCSKRVLRWCADLLWLYSSRCWWFSNGAEYLLRCFIYRGSLSMIRIYKQGSPHMRRAKGLKVDHLRT
jgi:hypothetical protein